MLQGRRGCKAGAPNPSKIRRFPGLPRVASARAAIGAACMALLSACASTPETPDLAATGATPADLNWAHQEKAAMQAEIAKLMAENARLERQVMDWQRRATAAEPQAPTVSEAELREPPVQMARSDGAAAKTSPPASKPVIEAPNGEATLPPAPVPVESAPRLVQPTFASAETVYENEAGDIALSSVLWGVHLASYRQYEEASAGWRKLQRENPDELGLLEPRLEKVTIPERGEFLRLIGGGFSSGEKAKELCARLTAKGIYCREATFKGEKLKLSESGQG